MSDDLENLAPVGPPSKSAGGLRSFRYRCRARKNDPPFEEQHAAFSISLVERGLFSCRSCRGNAVLGPGWLMLANAGDAYTCSHEHGDGSGDDCLVLSVSPERFEDLQSALGRRIEAFDRVAVPPIPRVAALLHTIVTQSADPEDACLEEAVLTALAAVQQAVSGNIPREVLTGKLSDRALSAARYIETHAHEPLSLATVAGVSGLSVFHLVRIFRRVVGVTPYQYLLRTRLQRAVALLRETDLPVTAVAYESGFADLSNFVRTFHREVGSSPRALRKQVKLGRLRAE